MLGCAATGIANSMGSQLESMLTDYLNVLESPFIEAREAKHPSESLHILRSTEQQIRSLVEELEEQHEFKQLVGATRSEFSKDDFERRIGGLWDQRVKSFFRRSGLYQNLFAGRQIDPHSIKALYQDAFERSITTTYVAPLEFVEFAEERMDFEDFQIRRFAAEELNELLKQRICQLFYPWAVVNTSRLAPYWFLVCAEEKTPEGPGDWQWSADIEMRYSPFSGRLKQAFRRLILYRWKDPFTEHSQLLIPKRVDPWAGPFQFCIPFTFAISDSLIEAPLRSPDLSLLAVQPVFDNTTGEEIGEEPCPGWVLSEEENHEFCSFIEQAGVLLKNAQLDRPEWRFADTALNFLEKAFLSQGAEQLLWHITTIEALLGEKTESGLTNLLKRRIALILGNSEEERKQIRKNFQELYDLRSDLVHGSATLPDRKIYHGHLGQAREIARAVTLWMLCYLSHIRVTSQHDSELPSRENILAVLDMDEKSRMQAFGLLSCLPEGFPHVSTWWDQG